MSQHRCAVCWQKQENHDDWFQHGELMHGASLRRFDYDVCKHEEFCQHMPFCPGLDHAKRLSNEGSARARSRKEPEPYVARDGTVYTPVPLPLDGAA